MPPGALHFGPFELDSENFELRRAGHRVKLDRTPMTLLLLLVSRAGKLVAREQAVEEVWGKDVFIETESALYTAIRKIRRALGDSPAQPCFIETVPRKGYRFIASVKDVSIVSRRPFTKEPGKHPAAIASLAVLPLENASGDPGADYLSDGIAETLINSLAQLRKIRVVPRTLTFRHRGPGVDPLAVGRELGARAVLTGRMVQQGDDLIVSLELVDVEQQAQLWGGRYNRRMTGLVELQAELAAEISEKLRLQLTREEKKKLLKRPTQNNEAFRLVLQAQHYINGISPEGLRKGVDLCQEATTLDPTYALAYARLTFAYTMMGTLGFLHPIEAFPRMIAAAKKALELDDALSEAHAGLGFSLLYGSRTFTSAEGEARRGLELNPDSVFSLALLAQLTRARGRFDEAIAIGKRAVELDPLDYYVSYGLGLTYYHARQFDKAIEQLQKTVGIDRGSPLAHLVLAQAYAAAGQLKDSLEEIDLALALGRKANVVLLQAASAYAIAGQGDEARRLLEEVQRGWKPDGASSFWIACVYAGLGEKEKAFEWLEAAYQEHAAFLVHLKIMHPLERLRDDPRFDDLVKRIGIPD